MFKSSSMMTRNLPVFGAGGCMFNIQSRGLKQLYLPPSYDGIELPERTKLKFIEKVPNYPAGLKPPKMQKSLKFMRGPEEIHTDFIHKQYGIVALSPGRLKHGHFEMMRLTIGRKMDAKSMFAMWRIDAPWQPITKKGQGKRMGGGKAGIDHYITPIKYGRVIVEMGGRCEYKEVIPILKEVAEKLPFKATFMNHERLEKWRREEKEKEIANINPYTFEYIVKNNMGKSHLWITQNDRKYFGKHR